MTTLLVASGGGHLKQLVEIAPRLRGVDDDYLWVTWESAQSRSLLDGRDVVYVRPTRPRAPIGVARNFDYALSLWRRPDVRALVTTGSQVVLPFLVLGTAVGKPCHFIESAARSDGPSLSGKISTFLPGMRLYTQYRHWEDKRWEYVGSVFDGFDAVTKDATEKIGPKRVVVTLGTLPRWEFRRLVDACVRVIPAGSDVLWQTGATDVSDLPIQARESVPAAELELATAAADVVISHAGVGSALTALRCGKRPILVPREAVRGEHVDDHQQQIAAELSDRNLAVVRSPETLSAADLEEAGRVGVVLPETLPPINLHPPKDRSSTARRLRIPGRAR